MFESVRSESSKAIEKEVVAMIVAFLQEQLKQQVQQAAIANGSKPEELKSCLEAASIVLGKSPHQPVVIFCVAVYAL